MWKRKLGFYGMECNQGLTKMESEHHKFCDRTVLKLSSLTLPLPFFQSVVLSEFSPYSIIYSLTHSDESFCSCVQFSTTDGILYVKLEEMFFTEKREKLMRQVWKEKQTDCLKRWEEWEGRKFRCAFRLINQCFYFPHRRPGFSMMDPYVSFFIPSWFTFVFMSMSSIFGEDHSLVSHHPSFVIRSQVSVSITTSPPMLLLPHFFILWLINTIMMIQVQFGGKMDCFMRISPSRNWIDDSWKEKGNNNVAVTVNELIISCDKSTIEILALFIRRHSFPSILCLYSFEGWFSWSEPFPVSLTESKSESIPLFYFRCISTFPLFYSRSSVLWLPFRHRVCLPKYYVENHLSLVPVMNLTQPPLLGTSSARWTIPVKNI